MDEAITSFAQASTLAVKTCGLLAMRLRHSVSVRFVRVIMKETGIEYVVKNADRHLVCLLGACFHSVTHADLERKVRIELS